MKKIIVPIIFLSVGLSLLTIYYVYNPSRINQVTNREKITKTKKEYRPGVLIVQFKNTDLYSKNFKISIDNKTGIAQTGIVSIDVLNNMAGVTEITKTETELYYQPRDNGLVEQPGLDRLYILKVSESADIIALAEKYGMDPNVEFAEPDRIIYLDPVDFNNVRKF